MRTTLVLFAVTMFTSMTITAADVPLREEQYRVKYGRYTPAFEAQRRANPATATDEIATSDCCRTLHHCPLPPVTAATPSRQAEPCEHACCQVAE